MEQKSIIANKPKNLLIHALMEKKNWTILTLVVLLVTVIIIPIMMERDIMEEFVVIGIVEVFIVILVNCLIDFNYLHDTRKYGYYLSKPLSNVQRLHLVLISNGLFAAFFLGILFMISMVMGFDIQSLFIVPVGWLIFLVMLTGLSSQLSGNTIIAGLATAFNFALPVIFLAVIYYAMDIVSNIAIGFNVNVIMDYIVSNIYRLDYLYLLNYSYDFSVFYFIILGIVSGFIYLMTRWAIKHRKNERVGEHIMFRGYKYFIAMAFSIIVPFFFSTLMNNNEYVIKLISFVLLGSITYYVSLVILDKSFKIKRIGIKILAIFMSIFILIIVIAGFILTSIEKIVPDQSEVMGVLLSNTSEIYVPSDEKHYIRVAHLEYEDIVEYNIPIYRSEEAVSNIIELQKTIVEEARRSEYRNQTLNMIYYMKDGSRVRRYFSFSYNDIHEDSELGQAMKALMATDENKVIRFPMIFDRDYRNQHEDIRIQIDGNFDRIVMSEKDHEAFYRAMRMDLEMYFEVGDVDIYSLGYNNQNVYFPLIPADKIPTEVRGEEEYIYVSIYDDDKFVKGYDIPDYFNHTRTLLKTITEEQSN